MDGSVFIAIDLKSFYASVECVERGLDPLTTNLVVADESRTEKTICLAVSPSLKAYGIPGRARLFEVVQKVDQANALRRSRAPGHSFVGASYLADELALLPQLEISYIVARPQMARYMQRSTGIYNIYLHYVAPEDIHVYSVDEVFIDATKYLKLYGLTAREFAMRMILDVHEQTGITATAGIGTNLYLCKIAMDIEAKHIPADENGVRIAELDEISYRRKLWTHQPLTDFWRVGRGYATKLEKVGLRTMGDIARCSIGKPHEFHNEDLLYKLFGVNAELLIDHAWGWEPCTMAQIKAYKPSTNSMGAGQVLPSPYPFDKARLIAREMAELLALDLVEKKLLTDQIVLNIGYDIENLADPKIRALYHGPVTTDAYGRTIPKPAHGSVNLKTHTSSTKAIVNAVMELFDGIAEPALLVRRLNLTANRVLRENAVQSAERPQQMDLFTDYSAEAAKSAQEKAALERERRAQEALLTIKRKFGKNAVLKGMNLLEGATTVSRNKQIGGHKE